MGRSLLKNNYTPAYGAVLGLLFASYTFTGYDGPSHMSEETRGAARATPRAVFFGFAACAVSGWLFAISMAYSVSSMTSVLNEDYMAPSQGLNAVAEARAAARGRGGGCTQPCRRGLRPRKPVHLVAPAGPAEPPPLP